uniref:Histone-lysine N-methyltransferase n=1 Tax=Heterorhabditis bacteriophora TaxID=37862 RepID=A0A1I7WTZ2_HETBA
MASPASTTTALATIACRGRQSCIESNWLSAMLVSPNDVTYEAGCDTVDGITDSNNFAYMNESMEPEAGCDTVDGIIDSNNFGYMNESMEPEVGCDTVDGIIDGNDFTYMNESMEPVDMEMSSEESDGDEPQDELRATDVQKAILTEDISANMESSEEKHAEIDDNTQNERKHGETGENLLNERKRAVIEENIQDCIDRFLKQLHRQVPKAEQKNISEESELTTAQVKHSSVSENKESETMQSVQEDIVSTMVDNNNQTRPIMIDSVGQSSSVYTVVDSVTQISDQLVVDSVGQSSAQAMVNTDSQNSDQLVIYPVAQISTSTIVESSCQTPVPNKIERIDQAPILTTIDTIRQNSVLTMIEPLHVPAPPGLIVPPPPVPRYEEIEHCEYKFEIKKKENPLMLKKLVRMKCECRGKGLECTDSRACSNLLTFMECPRGCLGNKKDCKNRKFSKKSESFRYARDNHTHHYMFEVGNITIDATVKGNCSRFMNHSCDPNAICQKVRVVCLIYKTRMFIIFVKIRPERGVTVIKRWKPCRMSVADVEEKLRIMQAEPCRNKTHALKWIKLMTHMSLTEHKLQAVQFIDDVDRNLQLVFVVNGLLKVFRSWLRSLTWSREELELKLTILRSLSLFQTMENIASRDAELLDTVSSLASREVPPEVIAVDVLEGVVNEVCERLNDKQDPDTPKHVDFLESYCVRIGQVAARLVNTWQQRLTTFRIPKKTSVRATAGRDASRVDTASRDRSRNTDRGRDRDIDDRDRHRLFAVFNIQGYMNSMFFGCDGTFGFNGFPPMPFFPPLAMAAAGSQMAFSFGQRNHDISEFRELYESYDINQLRKRCLYSRKIVHLLRLLTKFNIHGVKLSMRMEPNITTIRFVLDFSRLLRIDILCNIPIGKQRNVEKGVNSTGLQLQNQRKSRKKEWFLRMTKRVKVKFEHRRKKFYERFLSVWREQTEDKNQKYVIYKGMHNLKQFPLEVNGIGALRQIRGIGETLAVRCDNAWKEACARRNVRDLTLKDVKELNDSDYVDLINLTKSGHGKTMGNRPKENSAGYDEVYFPNLFLMNGRLICYKLYLFHYIYIYILRSALFKQCKFFLNSFTEF